MHLKCIKLIKSKTEKKPKNLENHYNPQANENAQNCLNH